MYAGIVESLTLIQDNSLHPVGKTAVMSVNQDEVLLKHLDAVVTLDDPAQESTANSSHARTTWRMTSLLSTMVLYEHA